jgi:3-oxoadipate enol-lactonase
LVLADTRSEADNDQSKLGRAAAIQAIKKSGLVPFADDFVKRVFAAKTLAEARPCVAAVRAMIVGQEPLGVCAAALAMLSRTDTTPVLDKMKVPALVLVGEQDALTPPACARALAAAIPGAAWASIPDAGHLSSLENPAEFNRLLLGFLRRLPR